ncbi:type III ribulose-bisphosphate carboxylase, partial [Candidatus Woesearchaeota archaeon]|nr:type III ribulose-bisphosphate carboxylase [Candidatus Woesearchaeota archaeon]
KYRPQKNDVICEYYVEPGLGLSLEKACQHIAGESSIGTWTTISTMSPAIARKLKPSVFHINKKTNEVRIAYHSDLFEAGNMPEILSSIAGNIFGMKAVKNLRLQDIHFPKKIIDSFLGPQFGIEGIRKLTRTKNRPLVGTIVKPKVGLNEKQHAKVAYEAWAGGLDVVKDDENLSSMTFNNFRKRMQETFKLRDKAEKETGEKKIYMPNITAETMEMLRRADYVHSLGGEYIMVDILTVGWAGLQTVRDYNKKLKKVIHAHRAMHGALTRNHKHGISMMTIAKCSRLIGVDQLHIGTAAVGKMHGAKAEELSIEEDMEKQYISQKDKEKVLEQRWYHIKPVLAVASGGLSPLSTPKLVKIMGKDIVAQYGGGCHGHPNGTRAGAAAIRQSLDAALKGIPLKKYSKTHKELAKAIKKWS